MTTTSTPTTPDAILDAAERLFAEHGFERTTAQAIGRAVHASPGLIYYYFGSKAGLYRAILERIIGGIARRGLAEIDPEGDPDAAIRGIVRIQADGLLDRPHLGRLIIREMLDHQASHAAPIIRDVLANLFARLTGVIRAGQASGRFRPGFDPRFAALSVVSQVAWLVTAGPAIGMLLGHGPAGPPAEVRAAFAAHAADFALAAL
ncbi:MAG TPA: TetR/AcrR family transcriptional regulator, partial [Gemmatimonadales bacterium]|nr:TetR/AcrR family transcriptional regulator [Gemmatimonadales bacterium]